MSPHSLADFETDHDLPRADYETRLEALQHRLELIQAAYIAQGLKGIVAIEGWDAAGKGGLVTRMNATLDPRYCKVWPIAAPSKEEAARHYLWRFWQRLPGNREIAVFDRTWYGRVLVERVDGFTPEPRWRAAYDEINAFEAQLQADGVRLVKIFLHITQEEQDKRLEERIRTPWKRWKTGADDYHNRSMRSAYVTAYEEMFRRCSPPAAPWHVVAANDKKWARVRSLELICEALGDGVDLSWPEPDAELVAIAEQALGKKLV
ncbi:polyphosphate kinase [Sandarakinorhabdus cyanobacteriorum]|uniref:Polyphosphate kinase n=1 Tax=Sandarakinorhabdus cyanobacteriorum TaxID=1981098 RepID=A0A255YDG9_9SPHN|nr:polyphosphate kinase [Sandarakinorhabdus cyanobacteriorum]OYQ27241.1 polyphosphate kinase [Sandarakinorhabdus cyanobacteriorum]